MNPTTEERHEGEMCADCLMLLASGETPTEMSERETEEWLAAIDRAWPESEGWHLAPAYGDDCEGSFSWSSCDVCGSKLGGDRHPVSAWRTVADDEYLGEMVAAYVACALWADPPTTEHDWDYGRDGRAAIRQCQQCGERETYWDDDEYPYNPCRGRTFDVDDITDDTMETIREECRQFIGANYRDLEGIDAEQAGHDFYLTRNRHGAGFWDRGNGAKGDRLADAARVWGSSELYAGDDGKLYVEG